MPRIVSATPEFDLQGLSRVRLELLGIDPSGTPVARRNPDGIVHFVRQSEGFRSALDLQVTIYDYEMPFNQEVSYYFSSNHIGEPKTVVAPLPKRIDGFIISPGDPGASVPVTFIQALGAESGGTGVTLQRVMNKKRPVPIVNTPSQGLTSSITVRTDTLAEAERMRSLLDNTAVLLISIPAFSGVGHIWRYVSRTSDWTMDYPDLGNTEQRSWAFSYAEVDRPVGNLLPIWNVAMVLEQNASVSDLRRKYRTVADLRNNRQQVVV